MSAFTSATWAGGTRYGLRSTTSAGPIAVHAAARLGHQHADPVAHDAEEVVVGGEEQHLVEAGGHRRIGDARHRVVRLPALGAVARPAHPARRDVGVAQLGTEVVRLRSLRGL